MHIGFIGTGKITSALVKGLATCPPAPENMIVSPRNRDCANDLSRRFKSVQVGRSNQDVIDRCETIFIALRADTARDALQPLSFKAHQSIISLIPTMTTNEIVRLTCPAETVSRAVPLPAVARRNGPILLYNPDRVSRSLLEKIGDPVIVPTEEQLHVLWAITGMVTPGLDLISTCGEWAASKGVDKKLALDYTASFFQCVAGMAVENGSDHLDDIIHEAATPGGLNEQASRMLQERNFYNEIVHTLDVLLRRFTIKEKSDQ
jgi:pyrroline-5-carboxylate reductase